MTPPDNRVSVFYFRTSAPDSGTPVMSTFKATREAINTHFGGVALEGTEERVPPEVIDEAGRYVSPPSSWTELT